MINVQYKCTANGYYHYTGSSCSCQSYCCDGCGCCTYYANCYSRITNSDLDFHCSGHVGNTYGVNVWQETVYKGIVYELPKQNIDSLNTNIDTFSVSS